MNCNCNGQKSCGCDFNIKTVGICDVSRLNFNGEDRSTLNWTEISVPEILNIPDVKPEIENIDQVYVQAVLDSVKLIETPFAYRRYPLCYLPESIITAIENITGTLLTDVQGIVTSVGTIVEVLEAIIGVPGLSAVIIQTVNDLITALNDALDGLLTAANDLIAAISLEDPIASVVCGALQALRVALETLFDLVNSVVGIVNNILQQVSPALAALITAAINAVLALVGGITLEQLVQGILDDINSILDPILLIDCESGYAYALIGNAEGTCLTGRKLIVEGTLKQKVVYTAEVENQSVHSVHFEVPFIAFIIPYAKFEGIEGPETLAVYDEQLDACREIPVYRYTDERATDENAILMPDLNEEFDVTLCVEDVYVKALELKKIFKNVTVFLKATPSTSVLC